MFRFRAFENSFIENLLPGLRSRTALRSSSSLRSTRSCFGGV